MFVRPRMSNDSMILPDSIGLKAAQPDQIKTIAYLLAQTVALHFYETCAGAIGLGLGLPYPSRTPPQWQQVECRHVIIYIVADMHQCEQGPLCRDLPDRNGRLTSL